MVLQTRRISEQLPRVLFGDDLALAAAQTELRAAWTEARAMRRRETREKRKGTRPERAPEPPQIVVPDRCFGREEDIAKLVTVLCRERPKGLILLGSGGMGKTTLASKVASDPEITRAFGTHRWCANLASARTAIEMEGEIARALGFDPAASRFPYILQRLKSRCPGLLVLDSLDSPWNEDRRAVREILRQLSSVDGLVLLATLRGTVAPDVPVWVGHVVERLSQESARQLFISHLHHLADDRLLDRFLEEVAGWPC